MELNHGRVTGIPREIRQLPNGHAGTSDHIVMRWHADDPTDANDMNKIKVRFSPNVTG